MNFKYLFLLGSHPDISAAECFTLLEKQGSSPTTLHSSRDYLTIQTAKELPPTFINQLGGTQRIARLIASQSSQWSGEALAATLHLPPDTIKVVLGISVINLTPRAARGLGQELKKVLQEQGIRLRFITATGKFGQLNAAQVLFNNLLTPPHREIFIIKEGKEFLLAETVQLQDIQSYEKRDSLRPVRDARVGMIPPKLAQILLNFAVAQLQSTPDSLPPTILDPFCGLGTIVQEGWLKGFTMVGSDISEAMISASQKNLDYIERTFTPPTPPPKLFVHDVRQPFPTTWHSFFSAVVTEPHLGKPLRAPLLPNQSEDYVAELADLYYAFFQNIAPLLRDKGRAVVLLPAFRQGRRSKATFRLLPQRFLDAVHELGYSQLQLIPEQLAAFFPPSPRKSLLYSRPDALVGREITVWEKR